MPSSRRSDTGKAGKTKMIRKTELVFFFVALLIAELALAGGSRRNKEVLGEVLKKAGPDTVVVFDLDDTLFDIASRRYQLTRDFASQPNIQREFPELSKRVLENFKQSHVGYGGPTT